MMRTRLSTVFKEKMCIACLMLFFVATVCVSCSEDGPAEPLKDYNMPSQIRIDVTDEIPVVVTSSAEFNRLFGDVKKQMGKIDFGKYDMVYVQGVSSSGINDITTQWDMDHVPYILKIDIRQNFTTEMERWSRGFLLAKTGNNISVKTEVIYSK